MCVCVYFMYLFFGSFFCLFLFYLNIIFRSLFIFAGARKCIHLNRRWVLFGRIRDAETIVRTYCQNSISNERKIDKNLDMRKYGYVLIIFCLLTDKNWGAKSVFVVGRICFWFITERSSNLISIAATILTTPPMISHGYRSFIMSTLCMLTFSLNFLISIY